MTTPPPRAATEARDPRREDERMSMSELALNREVATWLAGLAAVVEKHGDADTSHGAYYVAEVRVGYDGEDSGYRVLPNEFGGFDIGLTTPATDEAAGADGRA